MSNSISLLDYYDGLNKWQIDESGWGRIKSAIDQALEKGPSLPHKIKRDAELKYSILLLPPLAETKEKVIAVVLLKELLGGSRDTVHLGLNPKTGDLYAVVRRRFCQTTYNKLSPEEQQRLAIAWENRTERTKYIRDWDQRLQRFRVGMGCMQQLSLCTPQIIGSYAHTPKYETVSEACKNSHLCVLSYASRGNLCTALKQGIKPEEKPTIALQLLKAVKCMHAAKIAHLDLKPENIFLYQDSPTGELRVKITGFDRLGSKNASPCDMQSDLWSLGQILYTLFCNRCMMTELVHNQRELDMFFCDLHQQASQIKVDLRLTHSEIIPERWQFVISQLLRIDPRQRKLISFVPVRALPVEE